MCLSDPIFQVHERVSLGSHLTSAGYTLCTEFEFQITKRFQFLFLLPTSLLNEPPFALSAIPVLMDLTASGYGLGGAKNESTGYMKGATCPTIKGKSNC